MDFTGSETVNRRLAIGATFAATAGLTIPRQLRVRVVTQRGMVGGGVLPVAQGEASFSLFASRLIFAEGKEVVMGAIRWVELPSGLALLSTAITEYEVLESAEGELRRIRGTMSADGAGTHPFVMDVLDLGAPGSGFDEVTLAVGVSAAVEDAATPPGDVGFNYTAGGALSAGDLQDLDIVIDVDAGAVLPATPTG